MSDIDAPDVLNNILNSGNFDGLIGAIESDRLDFKGDPYHLTNDRDRIELAKDVTAMANHRGGVILIGPRTVKKKTHTGEEVETIQLFGEDAVDPKQYHDTLAAWVYPALQGVRICRHKSAADPEKGLFTIDIPEQPAELRPFLVKHSVVDGRNTGLLVGLMRRARDETDVMGIHEMHSLIRAGTSYAETLSDLSMDVREIKEMLSSATAAPQPPAEDISKILMAREMEALTAAGLHTGLAYVLSAMPLSPGHIPILFKPGHPDFRQLVHPYNFRSHGFDINCGRFEDSKPVRGELRRTFVKGYNVRDLWRDGCLVFGASGDFLCWGTREGENRFTINPLAVCESVYLFVNYYLTVVSFMAAKPQRIHYRIGLHAPENMKVEWELSPWSLNSVARHFDHYRTKAPASAMRLSVESGDGNAGAVAYNLVSEFYLWFGIEDKEGEIPYTDTIDGAKTFSEGKLKTGGGE